MIKAAYKCYLLFPPFARQAINISIASFVNGLGVDYYHSDPEHVLLDCNQLINKKLFI